MIIDALARDMIAHDDILLIDAINALMFCLGRYPSEAEKRQLIKAYRHHVKSEDGSHGACVRRPQHQREQKFCNG